MNRSIGPPNQADHLYSKQACLGKTAGRYNSAYTIGNTGATTMVDGRGPLMDKRA